MARGTNLATRGSSAFILNPPIPVAAGLQAWCSENAEKIKVLSAQPENQKILARYHEPKPADKVKIANLPTRIDKVEYPTVEGIVEVSKFNEKFLSLTCANCKKPTAADGDEHFCCNHCKTQVQAFPKIQFEVKIKDSTGSIDAFVYAEVAEPVFQITGQEMMDNIVDGYLSIPMMEKLSTPIQCSMNLKAQMFDYGGNSQCKFTIIAFSDATMVIDETADAEKLALAPHTPKKK